MLQQFFKRVFRLAEHHRFQAAGAEPGLLAGEAYPDLRLTAPELPAADAPTNIRSIPIRRKGSRAMHQSPNEPISKPDTHGEEQPDGKVVQLMPRQRPAPERLPDPLQGDDDDDPGPSAA